MAVEKFIAIASLGLFVMFSGEIVTIYHFMSQPQDTKTARYKNAYNRA